MKRICVAVLIVLVSALPAAAESTRAEHAVTLDVKDADVRDVLQSMREQCGIRNLVIDPDVSGKGTFYFREVPCETAFRTVFSTTGLRGTFEPNSVLRVSRR